MDWDFPKPEDDPKYRRDYDAMFGRGSFERDFLRRAREQPESRTAFTNTSANLPEYRLDKKFHWDYDKSVGVVQTQGKFVGVACIAAKEITNAENYIRKFGLDFKRDIQWKAISELLGHLSRNPMFKAVLITSSKIPLQLQPDIPEELRGRMNWTNRNYQYHKDALDVLNHDVKAAREFGTLPIPKKLLDRENQESLNALRFLNEQRALESQMEAHVKPYHQIKDKLFTACLLFYIYTSEYNNYEQALQEIIRRRYATRMEIIKSYFINCADVKEPEIVFTGFIPSDELLRTHGGIALSEDVAGFSSDKDVAIALRKFFTTTLEVPKEGVTIEEKIYVPEDLPAENERSVFLGYVVTSVVERKPSRHRVFFPLDILTKHAIITGSSGQGKTFFAMHLALEVSSHGIECVIIDPHGHFKLLPQKKNIQIKNVNNTEQIIQILKNVYYEALRQPISPREPKLKKLIIIDEISAGKFNIKKILPILNALFSEVRKFGYSILIICQYATEERGISPTVRENAETYFVFRKKTITELERIKTLKHPNMNLIPYLKEGFFMLYSEDFHAEPFFIKVPRIDNLLAKKEVYANHTEESKEHPADDINADDDDKILPSPPLETEVDDDDKDDDSNASDNQVKCKVCEYSWIPKKKPEEIRQCPKCNTRRWRQK